MSTEIFPFAVWLAGTTQNSIPANDNALRNEVLAKAAISIADAEPSESDTSDGDLHIVGTPWGGFGADDVVIYRDGTWYGFAPFDGWLKRLNSTGDLLAFEGSDGWVVQAGGGGGGSGLVPVNNQTGTSYTLALGDVGECVRAANANEITITVPGNSVVAFPVEATVAIRQVGAGQVVLDVDSDVTLNVPDGFDAATARQGSTIMLHKVDTNEWDITGDLDEIGSSS